MYLNCGIGEDSWESLWLQGYQTINPKGNQFECSLEGLMLKLKLQYSGHLMQRTESLEKTLMLGKTEGRRRDDRGWDGWMASPTWWTWIWVNSRRWWWTGRPGILQFMGSQSVGHNWATELSWTKSITQKLMSCSSTWCTKSAYPFFFTLLKGLCCSSSCLWLFSLLQLLPPMRI